MNLHAYRLTQRLGFHYCSDTRGSAPFIPVINAEIIACPQLPTTLPTLDELIGLDGIDRDNVAEHVLGLSKANAQQGHVYTLHAELEGMKLAPVFERLLAGWRAMGCELTSLQQYFEGMDTKTLPRCEAVSGPVPGRSAPLALQGEEFLARAVQRAA